LVLVVKAVDEMENTMKPTSMCSRALSTVTVASLLAVAAVAVLALGPGAISAFGTDNFSETLVLNQPVAPQNLVAAKTVATPEAELLANWEFTAKNPFGDAFKDVLQALKDANKADQDAAKALDKDRINQALRLDEKAAKEVLKAAQQLYDAAKDAKSTTLLSDANAMLTIYSNMQAHLLAGNVTALFLDTNQAQVIANKAVLDASPYK